MGEAVDGTAVTTDDNIVTSYANESASDATLNKSVIVNTPSPPILLSQFTPQAPGTRHDYTAMDDQFNQLKKQAATSKQL